MQLVLAAIAGCSSIDIITILQKQRQEISDFLIVVDGTRDEEAVPSVFSEIEIRYILSGSSGSGPLDASKVERAVELGIEKYCSVAEMLRPGVAIRHTVEIREETK